MSKKLSGLWKVIQASQKAKIILACTSVVAVGGVGAVSYDAYINKKAEVSKANKTYIEQSVSNENENKENELIEKKDIVDPNKVDSDSNSKTDSKSKNNSSNSKTDSKSKNNSSNSKTDNKSNNNSSNSKTDNKSNNNSSNSKPDTKPDTKPEPKPDTKPEPKPDTKPEPKPDTKPEPKPDTKPEPKPEPKPDTKPEPKPDTKPEVIPNGYNSEMTNFVNSSILNRYSGTKYAYFNSLLSDLGRGIKSKSQVESILQGYEWEEKGANYLGKVARVTVQSYDVVGNDKEKIGVNIQAGNYRYWKGVVYADNGVNKVAIIGIVINDIIFE